MSLAIKSGRVSSGGGVGRSQMVRGGDPGLWGAIKGAVGGLITGGPLGAITGGIAGAISKPAPKLPPVPTYTGLPLPTVSISRPAMPATGFGPAVGTRPMTTGTVTQEIGCPKGYRPNKSAYYTKSEGYIPKGTKCVRSRRMNSANPRALDRAMTRLNSAKRLQHKLGGYATPKYNYSGSKKKC